MCVWLACRPCSNTPGLTQELLGQQVRGGAGGFASLTSFPGDGDGAGLGNYTLRTIDLGITPFRLPQPCHLQQMSPHRSEGFSVAFIMLGIVSPPFQSVSSNSFGGRMDSGVGEETRDKKIAELSKW